MKVRDVQKSKLYKAERVLESERKACFKTLEEVEAYVQEIFATAWFKSRWPEVSFVSLKNGAGARIARGGPTMGSHKTPDGRVIRTYGLYMKLPKWARSKAVILHEMSHGLVEQDNGPIAAHGREFCQLFLQLVIRYLGEESGTKLRNSYKEHGVKYLPKRTLSPEQRAQAIERIRRFQKKTVVETAVPEETQ